MKTVCVVSKDKIPVEITDAFGVVPTHEAAKLWASVCIAIGGDGTVLEAYRQVGDSLPIAGLNTGHLGFLTNDVDLKTFIKCINNDSYTSVSRFTLSIAINNVKSGSALNEIVISNSDTGVLADIKVTTNNAAVRYHCDGLIITTATGSTAYNLSAGGSILEPDMDIIGLTPVAPFSMSSRPIIISMQPLQITCNHTATCTVDGKVVHDAIPKGTTIAIYKGYPMQTLHMKEVPFLTTIQEKLGWNVPLKFR